MTCPSATQCTVLQDYTSVVTFNPLNPASRSVTDFGGAQLEDIACPSTTQCTVLAYGVFGITGVTFNPQAPGPPLPPTVNLVPFGGSLSSLACPTTHQCSAVADEKYVWTFDPTAPVDPTRRIKANIGDHSGRVSPSHRSCRRRRTGSSTDTP